MLTMTKALEITIASVRRVRFQDALDNDSTLQDYGLYNDEELDLLRHDVRELVKQSGHWIALSRLRILNENSTIFDVARTISSFSLPGDETFEEPPG